MKYFFITYQITVAGIAGVYDFTRNTVIEGYVYSWLLMIALRRDPSTVILFYAEISELEYNHSKATLAYPLTGLVDKMQAESILDLREKLSISRS